MQHRDTLLLGQLHQFAGFNFGGEPFHPEIAGVNFQQGRGIIRDRVLVIPDIGPVGGAHVHQGSAALLENVRDPEAPSDLHGFAPGDDDLFAHRQSRQTQKQGGCVVVHCQGRFGSGYLLQQRLEVSLPGATAAGAQVHFQIGVASGGLGHGIDGRLAQRGPPQVCVDDYPGGVDHLARGHFIDGPKFPANPVRHIPGRGRFATVPYLLPGAVQLPPHQVYYPVAGIAFGQRGHTVTRHHPVHAGQIAKLHLCKLLAAATRQPRFILT